MDVVVAVVESVVSSKDCNELKDKQNENHFQIESKSNPKSAKSSHSMRADSKVSDSSLVITGSLVIRAFICLIIGEEPLVTGATDDVVVTTTDIDVVEGV